MFQAWDYKVQSLPFSAISPFLEYSTLADNKFHGHIPYQLGNLFRLKKLYLSTNQLQGSIPPTLGGCRSLRILSMYAITISKETFPKIYAFSPTYNSLT
jgi:hypothetical protein